MHNWPRLKSQDRCRNQLLITRAGLTAAWRQHRWPPRVDTFEWMSYKGGSTTRFIQSARLPQAPAGDWMAHCSSSTNRQIATIQRKSTRNQYLSCPAPISKI